VVNEDSIDDRMLVVIPKGAVAKDPRPAPGSVLPKNSMDLKVSNFVGYMLTIAIKLLVFDKCSEMVSNFVK
jgi:hypothetical protein